MKMTLSLLTSHSIFICFLIFLSSLSVLALNSPIDRENIQNAKKNLIRAKHGTDISINCDVEFQVTEEFEWYKVIMQTHMKNSVIRNHRISEKYIMNFLYFRRARKSNSTSKHRESTIILIQGNTWQKMDHWLSEK